MRDLQTEGKRGAGGLEESGRLGDSGPADLLAQEERGTQVSCAASVVAVSLQGLGAAERVGSGAHQRLRGQRVLGRKGSS